MLDFEIDGYRIGDGQKPYIIAELSGNHNGSLESALKHIELAKQCGADAVKIQTYTPDTMTIQSDRAEFKVKGGLWDGKTLYELYDWAHTPWDWHEALFEHARTLGITLFSSPFDETAVDFLESFDVPAYKIASFEMTDLDLVQYVASKGKPLIVSTGMATREEIAETVSVIRSAGDVPFALLHCVSSYPASHRDAYLKTVVDLRDSFGSLVGLSDHTLTDTTSLGAMALGACIVEKHFIESRSLGGPDADFSLEPNELSSLCRSAQEMHESLGEANYALKSGEQQSLVFRRSLFAVEDIQEGELLSEHNIRRIRPGFGLPPKYYKKLIGQKAPFAIEKGAPLDVSLLEALTIDFD